MLYVMHRLDAALGGLPSDGLARHCDVNRVAIGFLVGPGGARREGKRQYVGGSILAAIGGIQAAQQGVAAEHDGGLPATHALTGGMPGEGGGYLADRRLKARDRGPVAVRITDS